MNRSAQNQFGLPNLSITAEQDDNWHSRMA
jgi:hypothetical protein